MGTIRSPPGPEILTDRRVLCQMMKGDSSSYGNCSVLFHGNSMQISDTPYTDQAGACQFPFPDTDQHIAAAADEYGAGMFL